MKGVFMKIKSQVKSFAKIILFFNLLLFSSQAFTSEKLCEVETVVTLQNINQPGYNGRHGVVVGYVAAQGKYKVTLVDNKQTVLVPVVKAIRRVGSKVILHRIESFSHMHFNEKEGTIISYDLESKRYTVRVYCSVTKKHVKIQLKEEKVKTKEFTQSDLALAGLLDDSMLELYSCVGGGGSKSPADKAEAKLQGQIKRVISSFRKQRAVQAASRGFASQLRSSSESFENLLRELRTLQFGTGPIPSSHRGLNKKEMKDLVELQTYTKNNTRFKSQDNSAPSCAICLEEFEDGDSVQNLNCECKEKFYHKDCISQWLKQASSCPSCRSNLRK
jgi:hypothetical protein